MEINNAQMLSFSMETRIDAPPETVWGALTDKIGEWWPAPFYSGGEDGKRIYVLEAHPGGRMYEDWGNGGGALWATVVTVEPGRMLQVSGLLFPNWGGPTQWYGTWTLSAESGGTKMTYSEADVGRVSEDSKAELYKGWSFLWATMKAYLEGTTPPVWED